MEKIRYKDAISLIKEGDVLLFRGTGWIGSIISLASQSTYVHVGVASWSHGILECIEFREFKGGRSVNLLNYMVTHSGKIDVYRPIEYFGKHILESNKIKYERIKFEPEKVTRMMRKMSGLPYSWSRIWYIAKIKLAGFRLFVNYKDLMDDKIKDVVYPVCSTAVAHSFNCYGYDLVRNKSDSYVEPADIARSTRLSPLFTLIK